MTLQTSGVISLSDVNVELGLSSTAPISLNDTKVRELAGIASGLISLSNLYGKSDVQIITLDNTGGVLGTTTNWNLWNVLVARGITLTTQKVRVRLSNITISSTSVSTPGMEVGSGWPAGTQLEIVVGSGAMITGKGGAGGLSLSKNGSAGEAGGAGLKASTAITSGSITLTFNGGSVRGGGGGGGGGAATKRTGIGDAYRYSGGADGGNGAGPEGRTLSSGNGGAGGDYGLAGGKGGDTSWGAGGAGGAGGAAIVGSSRMTIVGAVDRVTTFGAILA